MTQYLLAVHDSRGREPLRHRGGDAAGVRGHRQVQRQAPRAGRLGVRRWAAAGRHRHGRRRGEAATSSSTDGPFAEAKEQLGGFWIITAPDLDAAHEVGGRGQRRLRQPGRGAPVPGRARRPDRAARWTRPTSSARSAPSSGRVRSAVATLVRFFGDIDVAEEAVQDAFVVALERWPTTGLPPSPAGWIITTARNRAIDRIRRESTRDDRQAEAAPCSNAERTAPKWVPWPTTGSDSIFTCCHPALAPTAQVALTLRLIAGLQTPEIARAFLVPEPTMAQRLVRAKNKIQAAKHPLPRPVRRRAARPAAPGARRRLPGLQRGLLATAGDDAHPGRAVRGGHPPRPPARRADARRGRGPSACWPCCCSPSRAARPATDADGALVRLADQDRGRWDRDADRRGPGHRPRLPAPQPARAVPDPGRHRRRAQRRRRRRRHRLGPDRRPLRPARRRQRRRPWSPSTGPSPWPSGTDPPPALALLDGLAPTSTATTCSTPPGASAPPTRSPRATRGRLRRRVGARDQRRRAQRCSSGDAARSPRKDPEMADQWTKAGIARDGRGDGPSRRDRQRDRHSRGRWPGAARSRRREWTTDAELDRPVDERTFFRISSMTKPVTAVAALILVEDCVLRLDDPVDRFLPELADPRVLVDPSGPLDATVPAYRAITLRDLLTFRMGLGMDFSFSYEQAGLGRMAELGLGVGPPAPASVPVPDEYMARLGHRPARAPTGDAVALPLQRRRPRRAGRTCRPGTTFECSCATGSSGRSACVTPGSRCRPPTWIASGRSSERIPTPARIVADPPDGEWSRPPRSPAAVADSCRRCPTTSRSRVDARWPRHPRRRADPLAAVGRS